MSENVQSFSGKVNVADNLLVGTSHFFVDRQNNRVGIGTSTPDTSSMLDVTGNIKSGGTITATGGFSGNGSGLSGVNSDSGSWVNGSSSNVHLAVSGDNVGIGMDNPNHKLDVAGDINISSGSTLRVGGTPAVFSNWTVDGSDIYRSSGNVGIVTNNPQFKLHIGPVDNNHLFLASSNNSYGWIIDTDDEGNGSVPLRITKRSGGVDTEVLTIKNQNGNVGIGVTNPDVKLHVGGGNIRVDGTGERIIENRNDSSDYGTLTLTSGYRGGSHRPKIQIHGYKGQGTVNGDNILTFHTNGSERMIINQNGSVGIGYGAPSQRFAVNGDAWINTQLYVIGKMGVGTNTPLAKLQVSGTGDVNIAPSNRQYFRWDYSNAFGSTSSNNIYGWGHCSIYASGAILSGDHVVSLDGTLNSSDERIKKNIVDADDAECLEVLRQLKPKKYQYKDEIKKGREPVWGFIAQEVRETLPYATKLRIDCIPNIYELANVSESSVITFTNFDTSTLGSTMVLRVIDKDDLEHFINIAEVVDEHSIRVEEDLSKWTDTIEESVGEKIFVFGQRVDDFIYLKKEAIWTVATAALQEVDHQLQAEKAELSKTKTDLQTTDTNLQNTRTELTETKADLQTTRTELTDAKTDLEEKTYQIISLEARLAALEQKFISN